MKGRLLLTFIFVIFSLFSFILAQEKEFITYKVDGKEFYFTDVMLEFHPDDGYVSIEGGKTEKIDQGPYSYPRYTNIEVEIFIQTLGDEKSMVGKHESNTSAEMPVYITWYEWIDKEKGEINELDIGLDSGDESIMIFTLIFENFGPPGSIVKGTFKGKLFDEEDDLHEVSDGKFAIKRTDVS